MNEPTSLSQLSDKVLQDPILLRKLCDRIYELMSEELRNQRDRTLNYRRFH